jgi:hypothetical protein
MEQHPGHTRRRTIKHRFIIAASIALLAAAAIAPMAASAATRPTAFLGLRIHDGIFLSVCLPSHMAMDDPIVHPGEPGASHQHEFFGNTTTDANSTLASLQAGETTCRIAADTAAYWVPTLLADGERVAPLKVNAYYLRAGRSGRIVPFPSGIKIIAGDSHATTAQSTMVTGWKCSGLRIKPLSAEPVACPMGAHNVLVIRFPDCWNGKDLDSADHQSHMAYRVRGACPAGFPVQVPKLSLNVHYQLTSVNDLTLSSGSIHTSHADFFNAWNQAALTRLVRANLN